jgi:hypothetical protein
MQPPQPIIYGWRSTPRCRPARIVARRRPAASIAPAAGKNGSHAITSRSALLPVTLLRRSSTSSIQKSSAPCARVERHRSLRRPFYHLHPGHLFVARPRLPDCRPRLISGNPWIFWRRLFGGGRTWQGELFQQTQLVRRLSANLACHLL